MARVRSALMTVCGFIVLAGAVYYGMGWIKDLAGAAAKWIVLALLLAGYVALIGFSARFPRADAGRPQQAHGVPCPRPGPTLKVRPALPAAGGGADLEPDGGRDVARAFGLLGHHVPGADRGHAATAVRAVPGKARAGRGPCSTACRTCSRAWSPGRAT